MSTLYNIQFFRTFKICPSQNQKMVNPTNLVNAIILPMLLLRSVVPLDTSSDCPKYLPTSYDKTSSPTMDTAVAFEYQIDNFDTIDVQTYVSFHLLRYEY